MRTATGLRLPVRPWQVLRGRIKNWARQGLKKHLPQWPHSLLSYAVIKRDGEGMLYQLFQSDCTSKENTHKMLIPFDCAIHCVKTVLVLVKVSLSQCTNSHMRFLLSTWTLMTGCFHRRGWSLKSHRRCYCLLTPNKLLLSPIRPASQQVDWDFQLLSCYCKPGDLWTRWLTHTNSSFPSFSPAFPARPLTLTAANWL